LKKERLASLKSSSPVNLVFAKDFISLEIFSGKWIGRINIKKRIDTIIIPDILKNFRTLLLIEFNILKNYLFVKNTKSHVIKTWL
jgi:hypothetical protein